MQIAFYVVSLVVALYLSVIYEKSVHFKDVGFWGTVNRYLINICTGIGMAHVILYFGNLIFK